MRIFLLMMGLFLASAVSAEVYRSVDEDGNVIYTDKPSPDAEEIHIDPIQTIEAPDIEPFKYTPPADTGGKSIYTSLEILSPENDEAIRSNAGDITVSAVVQPGLNISAGHQLVLIMDGKEVATGGPQFDLTNVDRGTHSASVMIKDRDGKPVMQSKPVTFTVLRATVKQQPAPPPPPPPATPPANPSN